MISDLDPETAVFSATITSASVTSLRSTAGMRSWHSNASNQGQDGGQEGPPSPWLETQTERTVDPLAQRRVTESCWLVVWRRSQVWATGPRREPPRLRSWGLCDERRAVEYWQATTFAARLTSRALYKDDQSSASDRKNVNIGLRKRKEKETSQILNRLSEYSFPGLQQYLAGKAMGTPGLADVSQGEADKTRRDGRAAIMITRTRFDDKTTYLRDELDALSSVARFSPLSL